MSFNAQEQALFDLLFDAELRKKFISNPQTAFSGYELNADEINDFSSISPDALALDAAIRSDLLLGQIRRVFPLSFAFIASLKNGDNLIKSIIDKHTMRSSPQERAFRLGTRLREKMETYHFDSPNEKSFFLSVLVAELGMAKTSALLKKELLAGDSTHLSQSSIQKQWLDKPIRLSARTSASIIPLPYIELKTLLGQTDNTQSPKAREKAIKLKNPRLLISLAVPGNVSLCDPTVDFKTLELNDGFAQLLQLANGTLSVKQILVELKNTGANDKILQSVEAGFLQMLEMNMLEII